MSSVKVAAIVDAVFIVAYVADPDSRRFPDRVKELESIVGATPTIRRRAGRFKHGSVSVGSCS